MVVQLMVWAGSNLSSFSMASEAIERLSGISVSARRIRRQVESAGKARVGEREAAVEQLQSKSLPERRRGNPLQQAPELAVVMMDGGRYQRRDHFGESVGKDGDTAYTHWRESKVGCLLTMASCTSDADPCPTIPPEYAYASAVQEIAQIAGNTQQSDVSNSIEAKSCSYQSPKLLSRDVVASGQSAEAFGWHLESKAFALNFPSAERSAFVADGAQANWNIQERHFPHCVPIADIIHVLSYVWSASQAGQAGTYQRWAQWIWQSDVGKVIEELRRLAETLGPPEKDAGFVTSAVFKFEKLKGAAGSALMSGTRSARS